MAIQRILQLGDPVLRQRSQLVAGFAACAATFEDLRDTLHEFQRAHGFGRGISAVQIGILQRVIYIELSGEAYCLINPEFEEMSEEKFTMWDDCFSFPNLMVRLERSSAVTVRYMNENGRQCSIRAEGPFSELLQHEVDHLNGILAVDRAIDRAIGQESLATREEWLRRYATH